MVAGRYRKTQYLIGPILFPIYAFALKGVFWFYLVPWFFAWIGFLIFSPSFRAARPGLEALGPLGAWLELAMWTFGLVTAGFAILDRSQARTRLLAWNPRQLPAPRDPHRIPRSSSVAEIVARRRPAVVGGAADPGPGSSWLVEKLMGPAGHASVWLDFRQRAFVPVTVLTLVSIVLAAVNLFRPRWTRLRIGVRAGDYGATAAILLAVVATHSDRFMASWRMISGTQRLASEIEMLARVIDLSVYLMLLIGGLICLGIFLHDLARLFKWKAANGAHPSVVGS